MNLIFHDKRLGFELRNAFDKAEKRIWIAVPFIGSWELVKRLVGINWLQNREIDIRLITDINNSDFIDRATYEIFNLNGKVKTLLGLHAKLYIIDDFTLLTSANLTGAAFSKRYEIGIKLKTDNQILSLFDNWWKISSAIEDNWKPNRKRGDRNKEEKEETVVNGLNKLWELPPKPITTKNYRDYFFTTNQYANFLKVFLANTERLSDKLPDYQELDSFFNFLFHEHKDTPTKKYLNVDFRKLNEKQRIAELKKYFNEYKKWFFNADDNYELYRVESLKTIQKYLSPRNINKITFKDVKKVVDYLHCMNSYHINKYKFLNKENNKIEDIKKEWHNLLFNDSETLEARMKSCNKGLVGFGKSAIQELLSLYYPNKYPVINRNSNCGMKFFGYDVKTY